RSIVRRAMAEASEIGPGTVLGETYEITELLGQGGMGAVWAAKHLRLPGKRVAIKVLHGLAANDRESYARFRREAEIASRIGHPNIVTVHDFNVLPSGTPYLVLEYLDGEDLSQRLARGKHTEIDARTDVFALGAIVYEMIAGRPAFMGSTLAEVVFKVVYDKQPSLAEAAPDTPAAVVAAVVQALAKEPNARFSDVAAF